MEGQCSDQPDTDKALNNQLHFFLFGPACRRFLCIIFQYGSDPLRQFRTVTEQFKPFYQVADQKTTDKHRNRHRRHAQEEIHEIPSGMFGNNQVLRFTDHGHHAAQCGTDTGMHHQAAQESTELIQCLTLFGAVDKFIITERHRFFSGRGILMINRIKPDRHTDHHGDHRQCIQKCG